MLNVPIPPHLKLYLLLKLHGQLTRRPGQLIKQSKDSLSITHVIITCSSMLNSANTHMKGNRFIQFNLDLNARIEDFIFVTIRQDMDFLYHMKQKRGI